MWGGRRGKVGEELVVSDMCAIVPKVHICIFVARLLSMTVDLNTQSVAL